jgi:hypothetical protein
MLDLKKFILIKENEKPEVKEFRVFLEKHSKYNPQLNPSTQEVDVRVGRACKGALEFTVKNNRKIHFVLDGLDINRVFRDLKKDKIDRAITGKEIKWLYRHRADDEVKKNVTFYENGQVTDAPWVKNPEQWEAYDEHRKSQEDKT